MFSAFSPPFPVAGVLAGGVDAALCFSHGEGQLGCQAVVARERTRFCRTRREAEVVPTYQAQFGSAASKRVQNDVL